MQVLKSFLTAFSTYSKIPVPVLKWREEDMKYIFCFFPWVGAVIGGCLCFWNYVCGLYHIGSICRTAVGMALPIFITGGIHIDGFMDTMDALHSYMPKEKKLEILKDSHIGAFAVIMLAAYGLLYAAVFSEIRSTEQFRILCCSFFLSRCLCGIGAVSFPLAKKEGMLYSFTDSSHKKVVKGSLYVQCGVCIGAMLCLSVVSGAVTAAAAVLSLVCYYFRSKKEFGGITGDTSGCFIVISELCMAAAAAGIDIFTGR